MNKGEQLNKMLVLATKHFDGIFDKGGQPYILHCLAVMHKLRTTDEELQCIALGHDLLEDLNKHGGRITSEDLYLHGFSRRVVKGIECMTKLGGAETYEEYKLKVKSNGDSIRVKKRDLMHNSDLRRMKGATEKDITRVAKYMQFYEELSAIIPD